MIAQLYTVLPEIAILVSACVVLIADLFVPPSKRHVSFWLTQIALLVTIWIVVATAQLTPVHAFSGMVVDDMLSDVLRLFALERQGDSAIRSYSTGQKKKIALCSALVTEAPPPPRPLTTFPMARASRSTLDGALTT